MREALHTTKKRERKIQQQTEEDSQRIGRELEQAKVTCNTVDTVHAIQLEYA